MSNTPPASSGLSILLVEDSEDDAELAQAWLRRDGLRFSLTRVETEPEFTSALNEHAPALVLCDFHLPRFSCRRVLEILESRPTPPPIVVVSRHIPEADQAEVLQRGVAAVVRKDRLRELGTVIRTALRRGEGS